MRLPIVPCLSLLLALPMLAGDAPAPYGVELGVFKPSGTWRGDYSNASVTDPPLGFTLGLNRHFAARSRFQGRVRLAYFETGKAPETQVEYSSPEPLPPGQIMVGRQYWRGLTLGYDWLPHFQEGGQHGFFMVVGAHGVAWKKYRSGAHPAPGDLSASNYATNSSQGILPSILLTYGLGYRFDPRATLELRGFQTSSNTTVGDGGKGAVLVVTYQF